MTDLFAHDAPRMSRRDIIRRLDEIISIYGRSFTVSDANRARRLLEELRKDLAR